MQWLWLVVVFGLQYDSIICISPLLLHTPAAGSVALTSDLNTANVKAGEDEGEGVGWFVVPPNLLSGWGGHLILILMIDDTGCRVQPQCV